MEDNIAVILKPYRAEIDTLDAQLVDLLLKRAEIIQNVARIKAEKNIPAVLEDRIEEVLDRCVKQAQEKGSHGEYVREIYQKIIHLSCEMEKEIKTGNRQTG